VQDVPLDHEARYWSRVANQFRITFAPPTRRCLDALTTRWDATIPEEAHRILEGQARHHLTLYG
jgi:hypothetical protein